MGRKFTTKIYGLSNRKTVILLHGGLGAAEDFGGQITALSNAHKVVAIDSRGHGRSTEGDKPINYNLIALDVIAVMDSPRYSFSDHGRLERRRCYWTGSRYESPAAGRWTVFDRHLLYGLRVPALRSPKTTWLTHTWNTQKNNTGQFHRLPTIMRSSLPSSFPCGRPGRTLQISS